MELCLGISPSYSSECTELFEFFHLFRGRFGLQFIIHWNSIPRIHVWTIWTTEFTPNNIHAFSRSLPQRFGNKLKIYAIYTLHKNFRNKTDTSSLWLIGILEEIVGTLCRYQMWWRLFWSRENLKCSPASRRIVLENFAYEDDEKGRFLTYDMNFKIVWCISHLCGPPLRKKSWIRAWPVLLPSTYLSTSMSTFNFNKNSKFIPFIPLLEKKWQVHFSPSTLPNFKFTIFSCLPRKYFNFLKKSLTFDVLKKRKIFLKRFPPPKLPSFNLHDCLNNNNGYTLTEKGGGDVNFGRKMSFNLRYHNFTT